MQRLTSSLRNILRWAVCGGYLLLVSSTVWAQAAGQKEAATGSNKYYLVYPLALFLIVLAMLVVCRPSRRQSAIGEGSMGTFIPGAQKSGGDEKGAAPQPTKSRGAKGKK